jgi:integrase/recombinase XerD
MKTKKSNKLSIALEDFFLNYLPKIRAMSPNTIHSYRDAIKLFLKFVCKKKKIHIDKVDIDKIESGMVISFLNDLEKKRGNKVATRNIRLAGLHSFFRYFSEKYPEYTKKVQRILNVPFKKHSSKEIEYFEYNEMKAVLKLIDRKTLIGKRDYAIISLMFNTGCRVQELVKLETTDLTLDRPFSAYLHGKGRKERNCPIWPQTASLLRNYLEERGVNLNNPTAVFVNYKGEQITRFGINHILKKRIEIASDVCPSLTKKHLHPHSIRHSTAIHLLKSGVDISTIALWLGHESLDATSKYVKLDIEMKRKILNNIKPFDKKGSNKKFISKKKDILKWLEAL